jgi:hypothetical protein
MMPTWETQRKRSWTLRHGSRAAGGHGGELLERGAARPRRSRLPIPWYSRSRPHGSAMRCGHPTRQKRRMVKREVWRGPGRGGLHVGRVPRDMMGRAQRRRTLVVVVLWPRLLAGEPCASLIGASRGSPLRITTPSAPLLLGLLLILHQKAESDPRT